MLGACGTDDIGDGPHGDSRAVRVIEQSVVCRIGDAVAAVDGQGGEPVLRGGPSGGGQRLVRGDDGQRFAGQRD